MTAQATKSVPHPRKGRCQMIVEPYGRQCWLAAGHDGGCATDAAPAQAKQWTDAECRVEILRALRWPDDSAYPVDGQQLAIFRAGLAAQEAQPSGFRCFRCGKDARECLCDTTKPAPAAPDQSAALHVRDALSLVAAEVSKATAKFPTWPTDPLHALAVLGEEFGELTKAMLQHTYEPHKATAEDVREEAIQTAAMAVRVLMSLRVYQYKRGEQHGQ
jgi:NTP pyrophosphatase (non-canonical NTP hydrolase)